MFNYTMLMVVIKLCVSVYKNEHLASVEKGYIIRIYILTLAGHYSADIGSLKPIDILQPVQYLRTLRLVL